MSEKRQKPKKTKRTAQEAIAAVQAPLEPAWLEVMADPDVNSLWQSCVEGFLGDPEVLGKQVYDLALLIRGRSPTLRGFYNNAFMRREVVRLLCLRRLQPPYGVMTHDEALSHLAQVKTGQHTLAEPLIDVLTPGHPAHDQGIDGIHLDRPMTTRENMLPEAYYRSRRAPGKGGRPPGRKETKPRARSGPPTLEEDERLKERIEKELHRRERIALKARARKLRAQGMTLGKIGKALYPDLDDETATTRIRRLLK